MAWDSQHRTSQAPPWRGRESGPADRVQPLEPRPPMETRTCVSAGPPSPVAGEESFTSDNPPLVVSVSVKFTDPAIRTTYRRIYGSSRGFKPSDRICDGLLRRIEHCCEELITRRDSAALSPCNEETDARKHLRFEMTFGLLRRDTGERTERTFKSYQNEPLSVAFAKEIALSSHRMVGLFLSHHDKEFRWLDGPLREDRHHGRETVVPLLDAPLPPCCIPRSRFIESSQSFEFVPGYTIEVSFRSRSQQRPAFTKVLRINSRQNSPLNLMLSENLLWQSFQSVHSALESKKRQFDEKHHGCELLEGTFACRHFDDEALHLTLRLTNNLGPSYGHLHREIKSKLTLFGDLDGRDCWVFLSAIESQLMEARDHSDSKINQMNDFELRILELKSPTWSTLDPLRFSLDPSASYSRRSIDAVLERVQTGIGDVLRGNSVAARVSAYKRGHLVLEKAFVGRQDPGGLQPDAPDPKDQENDLVSRLRTRIQEDVGKVCKDTCSLNNILEDGDSRKTQETVEPRTNVDKQDHGGITSGRSPLEETAVEQSSGPRQDPVPRRFPLVRGSKTHERLQDEDSIPVDNQDPAQSRHPLSTDDEEEDSAGQNSADEVITRPSSTYTLPGLAPGQRVFPLIPDKFLSPCRVSSGCILENESLDLPAGVQTDGEVLGEREDLEEAPEENETRRKEGQAHPTQASPKSSAADLAADGELEQYEEIAAQDSVSIDPGECSIHPVEDVDVVIEESVPTLGELGQTVEDAHLAVQVPALEAKYAIVTAGDATSAEEPEPTESPELVEDIVVIATPAEELDSAEKLESTLRPEPAEDVVVTATPAEKPESAEELEPTERPEPAKGPEFAEEAVPAEELVHVETGVENPDTEQPPERVQEAAHVEEPLGHIEVAEEIGEELGEGHDETCSLTAEPAVDGSAVDEFGRSGANTTQTLEDVSDDQSYRPRGRCQEGIELGDSSRVSGFGDTDCDWTAPSTPSLSSGCESSPRNSLIVTPHNLAALPGMEPLRLRVDYTRHGFEPETDSVNGLHEDCPPDKTSPPYRGIYPAFGERAVEVKEEAVSGPEGRGAVHVQGVLPDDTLELSQTDGSELDQPIESGGSELEGRELRTTLFPVLDRPQTPQRPLLGALASANPFERENTEREITETRTPTKEDAEHTAESERHGSPGPGSDIAEFDCGSSFLEAEPDGSTPRLLTRFGPILTSEAEAIRAPGLETPQPSDSEHVGTDIVARKLPDTLEFPAYDGPRGLVEAGADTETRVADPSVTTTIAPASGIPIVNSELPSESEEWSATSPRFAERTLVQTRSSKEPEEEASATPALGSPFLLTPPVLSSHDCVRPSYESPAYPPDGPSGRGSVDDIPRPDHEKDKQAAPAKDYRPATAGYLGLHERSIVEVGLRGALGGSRRLSLPLDQMLDRPSTAAVDTPSSLVPVAKTSVRSETGSKKAAKRPKSFGGSTAGLGPDAEGGGPVLPRMVMIFAGMALASKVLNKAG